MTTKETLIKLIQESVDGCAENWAAKIAEYLLEHGTYIYDKKPMDIIEEPRLTDPRFLTGVHKTDDKDTEVEYAPMPDPLELYQRLGIFENLYEDGMLMQFKPIDTESGDKTF